MEENKNNNQPNKLTYEELQGIAGGLKQQNDHLQKELNALRQYVSEQQTIFSFNSSIISEKSKIR